MLFDGGFAEGGGGGGFGKEFGDGGFFEGVFDEGEGVIEAPVEGAEADAMGLKAEGTGADAGEGIDGLDDIEDGDLGGGAVEGKAAVDAALGTDESGTVEGLQDLVEVTGGTLVALAMSAFLAGAVEVTGEIGDDAESVFVGLGKHSRRPRIGGCPVGGVLKSTFSSKLVNFNPRCKEKEGKEGGSA